MTKSRLITGLAIALGLFGFTLTAVRADPGHEGPSGPQDNSNDTCEAMPDLWTAAGEITYDPEARTVTFEWHDGETVTLRDTDPGCEGQPGLEEELRANRDGWIAQERVDCMNLRNLVDEVRAERRSQGQSTNGRVPVSVRAAEAAMARTSPGGADDVRAGRVREKHAKGGPWTIDLDYSDQVLARCPQ